MNTYNSFNELAAAQCNGPSQSQMSVFNAVDKNIYAAFEQYVKFLDGFEDIQNRMVAEAKKHPKSVASLKNDIFKKIASREPIECKILYQNPFEVADYSLQIISTNVLPRTTEPTEGYFRRFMPIPFDTFIPIEERNFRMNKVDFWEESGELPGILNRVIAGLKRLVQNGSFTESESSKRLLEEYRRDSDTTQVFMLDEGYSPGTDQIALKELYREYRGHCGENGFHPVSSKTFAQRLRNQGYVVKPGKGNINYVHYSKTVNEVDWKSLYPAG